MIPYCNSNAYLRQKHFRVASSLPSREALKQDLRRESDLNANFVSGVYVQPEMREKVKLPDLGEQRLVDLGFKEHTSTNNVQTRETYSDEGASSAVPVNKT
jgi:hypothetical protein